jgi:hypothetical protein
MLNSLVVAGQVLLDTVPQTDRDKAYGCASELVKIFGRRPVSGYSYRTICPEYIRIGSDDCFVVELSLADLLMLVK